MDVQLIVVGGSKAGQGIPIVGPKFLIGRADDCQLKPRSELISRYHCAIVSEDGYVAIRDLGSKNGVYLNGERVGAEQELQNGDKISLGPLEFMVQITVAAHAPKKSKVESISDAVSRTVQIQSEATQSDSQEADIADWLLPSGDGDDMETRTIDASELLASLQPKEEPTKKEEKPKSDSPTGSFKKDAPASSRDAAANLLKNFFKGGR